MCVPSLQTAPSSQPQQWRSWPTGSNAAFVSATSPTATTGTLTLSSVRATYDDGHEVDPSGQVDYYRAATSAAVAAGYQGLRVVADATPLVRTPSQLRQFLRYEHLVDHMMVGEPFSAMCGYDATQLDTVAIDQLACLHPHSTGHDPSCHLSANRDGTAHLTGETDGTTCDMLADLCDAIWPADGLVIDLGEVAFIDHRSLLALDATAVRHAQRLRLRHPSATIEKVVGLLDLRATELVA
jgi:anti-anti-sigma regulatory factor